MECSCLGLSDFDPDELVFSSIELAGDSSVELVVEDGKGCEKNGERLPLRNGFMLAIRGKYGSRENGKFEFHNQLFICSLFRDMLGKEVLGTGAGVGIDERGDFEDE